MRFLLDTSIVSEIMRENPRVEARLSGLASTVEVLTCSIVRGEIYFGIERLEPGRRREGLEAKTTEVFDRFPCEPVPATAGDHYARIKVAAQRAGKTLNDNDLWIVAMPLALGTVLVSRDSDYFRLVGVAVEDWTQP